ncbi:hypothetical protein AAG906_012621 [Vitis piasezkii]
MAQTLSIKLNESHAWLVLFLFLFLNLVYMEGSEEDIINLTATNSRHRWTGPLLLISLTYLSIWLQQLTSLLHLQIRGCPKLQFSIGSVLQRLISLKELGIYSCGRLQSLTEAGLHHLTTLETLIIWKRLPDSVSSLYVRDCPLLKQRLQFEKGEEWRYISHIPKIEIGFELF